MNSLTAFGKEVRKLRIEKNTSLKEMASALDVTSAYLSAVEMGRKRINEDLVNRIAQCLGVSKSIYEQLMEAAKDSQPDYKLRADGMDPDRRVTVSMFARRISEMDSDQVARIRHVLEEES